MAALILDGDGGSSSVCARRSAVQAKIAASKREQREQESLDVMEGDSMA